MTKILIDKETVEMALEALTEIHVGNMTPMAEEAWKKAITALRQALEQPTEQEPVAAQCKFDNETTWGWCSVEHHNLVQSEPEKWPQYNTRLLYTQPQEAALQRPQNCGTGYCSCIECVMKPSKEAAPLKPLTREQRFDLLTEFEPHRNKWEAPAILIDMVEAAHGITGEKE